MSTDITLYEFKAGFKHEIEVLDVGTLSGPNQEKLLYPHRANFYLVVYFVDGPHEHQVDFKSIEVPEGAFLFLNKEQVHRFDRRSAFKGKLILFTEAFFYQQGGDLSLLRRLQLFNDFLEPAVVGVRQDEKYLCEYFERIERVFQEPADIFHYELLHNHLSNFLIMAERCRRTDVVLEREQGMDLELLTLFRDLVNTGFKERRSVADYAMDMSITERRLTQATQQGIGKTPKQLIDERMLLEAKRLMVHTQHTIKEVGYELGFDEPTNFVKYFRKHTGYTPKGFREMI